MPPPGFPHESVPPPPPPKRARRARVHQPGYKTTELWGKSVLQLILVANVVFKLGLDIDDEFAIALAGVLETGYAISRGISKRASAVQSVAEIRRELHDEIGDAVAAAMRAQPQPTVNVVSVTKEVPAP